MIETVEGLRAKIREVPDFPVPGILFYDITTLLKDREAFRQVIELMADPFRGQPIDLVVAMEARAFIFGAPLAYLLGSGFVPIRKPGKLPAETLTRDYQLEYATNRLQIHTDAIQPGQRVLLVDDLLATGGTAAASIELVQELGGVPVALVVLLELLGLNGRARLEKYGVDVLSFITYE